MAETLVVQRALHIMDFLESVGGFAGTADEMLKPLARSKRSLWKVGAKRAAFNTAVTASRKPKFIEQFGRSVAYQTDGGKRWGCRPVWLSVASSLPTVPGAVSLATDGISLVKAASEQLVGIYMLSPSESNRKSLLAVMDSMDAEYAASRRDVRVALLSMAGVA